jgi:Mg-chelatase subunit ChlD
LVCLDVSRSMLARDPATERQAHTRRREIRSLAEEPHAGDRQGLIAFAGEDASLVRRSRRTWARSRSWSSRPMRSSVKRGGTNLGAALRDAR